MDAVDDLCDKLASLPSEAIAEEAVCCIRNHLLTEEDLEALTDEELAEAFPTLGVRKAVCRIIGRSSNSVQVSIAISLSQVKGFSCSSSLTYGSDQLPTIFFFTVIAFE